MIDSLVQRVLTHRPNATSGDRELTKRTNALADLFVNGVRPSSVRWVSNQQRRWGSCTPSTREIRISERLRPVPSWVLDAVLVHELAHLVEEGHTRRFEALARRYPRMEDADVFLDGYNLGLEQGEASESREPFGCDAPRPKKEQGSKTRGRSKTGRQARLF